MKKVLFTLFFFQFVALFSQNNLLQSGPMVGYCEMKEAMIWVQSTKEVSVRIDYFDINNPKEIFSSATQKSESSNGFTNHIVLNKLQPSKQYNYDVFFDEKKIELP